MKFQLDKMITLSIFRCSKICAAPYGIQVSVAALLVSHGIATLLQWRKSILSLE